MGWKITTVEKALKAVKKGYALRNVPEEFRTTEVCLEAIKMDSNALGYVPIKLMTAELCREAIQYGSALGYVPMELRTHELCIEAINLDSWALSSVPLELKTPELCREALKKNSKSGYSALMHVPKELRTAELCLEAVKNNGSALQDVPKELRTTELCLEAVRRKSHAIFWMPEELVTAELCLEVVKMCGWDLGCIPEKFKTLELCVTAVEKNESVIDYVPPELQARVKEIIGSKRYEVWDSSTPPQKLGIRTIFTINDRTYSFLSVKNYLLEFGKDEDLKKTAIRFSEANQGGYPLFAIRWPNWILYNPHNGGTFYEFCDKTFDLDPSVDGYQSSYAVDGTPQNTKGGTGYPYYQMKTITRAEIGLPDVITLPLVFKAVWGIKSWMKQ